MNKRVLITGSTIGRALAVEFARSPDVEQVYLTSHRNTHAGGEKIQQFQLDLTAEEEIAALVAQLPALDGVVVASGFLHDGSLGPEKSVKSVSAELLGRNIALNTLPAMLLAKHTRRLLKASPAAFFTAISARVGSIGENELGGWYSYRASKAALNMFLKTLSVEWRRDLPNCTVAALHPGTVESPLSAPFTRRVPEEKLFSPEQSARYLKQNIDQLKPDDSGAFLSWDGRHLPW